MRGLLKHDILIVPYLGSTAMKDLSSSSMPDYKLKPLYTKLGRIDPH